MNFLELSIKDVKEKSSQLYERIIKYYNYDLVIFIAKGSYIIGEKLATLNNVELLEIHATRKGNKIKNILKPLLKLLPSKIIYKLRKKELNSLFHKKNNERKVKFDKSKYCKYLNKKNILLIDDSIDTGNSIFMVREKLKEFFVNSNIKIAVFNVMNQSTITPDFSLYENTIIRGPWSSDSKENKEFIRSYFGWRKNYEKKSN